MKPSRTAISLLAVGIAAATTIGMAAGEAGPPASPRRSKSALKAEDATVRISSVPPGAMVMLSAGVDFQERAAVPLGKTPLLRLLALGENSIAVRITKTGYEAWSGRLCLAAPEVKADLSPLTDAQKQQLGWFVSPPCKRLTVVPLRLGIKKIGSKTDAFENSNEAVAFTNRFLSAFETRIKTRFGEHATLAAQDELAREASWQQLTRQMEGIDVSTIGFTPAPRRLEFSPDVITHLAKWEGAVLFLRAEAYYLGGAALFARTAGPLLLAAGSAAGPTAVPHSGGPPLYTYTAYKAPPLASDVILVQMFLVHSSTRELLWYGQVIMPQYYKHEQVTEKTATKAAEQVPAAFLGRQ